MGAPTYAERQPPLGIKLDDGFKTLVTIGTGGTELKFWEKTITPPGIDGGDAIDTSTMHNTEWRTYHPRSLKTLTEMTVVAAYDPDLYSDTQLRGLINSPRSVSVEFPDGSTLAFWGYLRSFSTNELVEGTQPEITLTIQPTNQDDSGAEQDPVLVETATT